MRRGSGSVRKANELMQELSGLLEAQRIKIEDLRLENIGLKAEVARLQRSEATESAWETLGLEPGSTPAEIQAAFRALSKRLHPDAPGGDAELFQDLVNARDALSK